MPVVVRGIGWFSPAECGGVRSGRRGRFDPAEGPLAYMKREVFLHPVKNLGRLDGISRATVCAVALALRDAGVESSPSSKRDIGIVGTGSEGSLSSDLEYFKDYVGNGRTLSRGNLFIYTLPTSPLGEAAIHFGLTGPLLYVSAGKRSFAAAAETAARIVEAGEAGGMLVGRAMKQDALYLLLDGEPGNGAVCRFAAALAILEEETESAGIVSKFTDAREKEG
jgi:3-oxoacyl-[acyl-carrier-protein] synthase II